MIALSPPAAERLCTSGSRLALAPWPARTAAGEKTPLQTPVATQALVNPRAIVMAVVPTTPVQIRYGLTERGRDPIVARQLLVR
jgi:hypothetical protein